jgi:predicted ATPase
MFIELKNINKIKSAKIEIGGLTVLTGNNDTGKSTVGKVLFSMIKALVRRDTDFSDSRGKKIYQLVEKFYITNRRKLLSEQERELFKKEFYPPYIMEQLKLYIDFLSLILKDGTGAVNLIGKEVGVFFLVKKEVIENLSFLESVKSDMKSKIDGIRNALLEDRDEMEKFLEAIKGAFHSEFYSKVCSQNANEGEIRLGNENNQFSVIVNNDRSYEAGSKEILTYKPFSDATFIETPLYIQLKDVLDKTGTLYDINDRNKYSPKVPLHIKDLLKKVEYAKYSDQSDELSSSIRETIGGAFSFDKNNNEFVFKKKINKRSIPFQMTNVASGIKVFGIIQLLLDAQEIMPGKLLILDEPENHLHPAWQLVFAQLLLTLVQKRVPVVLTSHSPYFIQAIKHYAKIKNMEDEVSFYLAEIDKEDDSMVTIEDVTSDLNKVFVKLAEPFQKIL